jgi:hypothetical protein
MIAVVIAVVIVVAVMVVVPIMVAPCPRVFQVATAAFCLAAVFTMLALGVMQFVFGFANPVFAFSVVIAIKRPRGNRPAQE